MSNNIVLDSGRSYIVDAIKYYIDNVTGGLYVGLMKNTSILITYQLPSTITEVTSAGYSRKLCNSWSVGTTTNSDPYLEGTSIEWTNVENWSDVNGYFISTSETGNVALFAQLFPYNKRGPRPGISTIKIIPKYMQL